MPKLLTLELTPEQRTTLEQARDHHPRFYVRERSAALLKLAEGFRVTGIVTSGLLKRRSRNAFYRWYHAYTTSGIVGLFIQEGRGRKPAFPSGGELSRPSPRHPDPSRPE